MRFRIKSQVSVGLVWQKHFWMLFPGQDPKIMAGALVCPPHPLKNKFMSIWHKSARVWTSRLGGRGRFRVTPAPQLGSGVPFLQDNQRKVHSFTWIRFTWHCTFKSGLIAELFLCEDRSPAPGVTNGWSRKQWKLYTCVSLQLIKSETRKRFFSQQGAWEQVGLCRAWFYFFSDISQF